MHACRSTLEDPTDPALERRLHAVIKRVTDSVESLRFNTAISEMMVFVNEAMRAERIPRRWMDAFLRVLAPFAPHLAEELWERLGNAGGLTYAPWPTHDEAKLKAETVTVAVQINGKLRSTVELPADVEPAAALAAARAEPKVAAHLGGRHVRREVYVPKRLINFVVDGTETG